MIQHSKGNTGSRQEYDVRPIPDPTDLTTKQLTLAIGTLRDLLEARLDGMDKANELHQKGVERIPDLIQKEMRQLNDVNTEKFNAIFIQFSERDIRTLQTNRDRDVAVSAALQAAKGRRKNNCYRVVVSIS